MTLDGARPRLYRLPMLLLLACAPEAPVPATPAPAPAAPAAAAPAALAPAVVTPSAAPSAPTLRPLRGWPDGLPTTWTRLTERDGRWIVETPCKGDPPGLQFGDDVFYRLGPDGPEDLGAVVGVLLKGDAVTVRYQAPEGIHAVTVRWGDPAHTWLQEGDARYAVAADVGGRWPVEKALGC